jgi:hypothetical protein
MVTPLGSRTCFGAPLGAFVVPVALTWLAGTRAVRFPTPPFRILVSFVHDEPGAWRR